MKHLLILFVLVTHVTALAQTEEESFSRSELLQDFDFMLERIESTHPDIAYSLDTDAYEDLKAQVKLSLHDNMTTKDAWLSLSLVNPAFRDAHTGVLRPRALLENWPSHWRLLLSSQRSLNGFVPVRLGSNLRRHEVHKGAHFW